MRRHGLAGTEAAQGDDRHINPLSGRYAQRTFDNRLKLVGAICTRALTRIVALPAARSRWPRMKTAASLLVRLPVKFSPPRSIISLTWAIWAPQATAAQRISSSRHSANAFQSTDSWCRATEAFSHPSVGLARRVGFVIHVNHVLASRMMLGNELELRHRRPRRSGPTWSAAACREIAASEFVNSASSPGSSRWPC